MATEIDKLLREVQSLSPDDLRRVRRVIDERPARSEPRVSGHGSAQLQALHQMWKELAALPVQNPPDGLSSRDHDRLLYGEELLKQLPNA